jgi:ABC-type dipeptide/oligopeptide/nickel transport system permease subunit
MSGVEIVGEAAARSSGLLRRRRGRFATGGLGRHPVAGLIAAGYLVAVVIVALLAPWIAPHDPNAVSLYDTFKRPSWGTHLLGTDELGRDELSRLVFGARISLIAALIGTSVAVGIGTPLGVVSGYLGGKFEALANFFFDALMSMPAIIFALVVIAVLGPGLVNAMVTIGVVISPVFYRLARAATNNIKHDAFIEASISIGCSKTRMIVRHLVPNVLTPIVTQCAVVAGACIVAEASISFLGLGVKQPTASWGSMLTSAQRNLYSGAYLVYFPGIAILLTVLACSLVGDWLRRIVGLGRRSKEA